MIPFLLQESFPGSGVTNDGTRINPNMQDYGKLPFVIEKVAKAKAKLDDPRFQRLIELLKEKHIRST